MANNKEVIEIEVVSNYKQALKEANAELIRVRDTFGETSAQAIQAAQRVGELKDKIADAKTQAAAFEGGGAFRAVTAAASSAAGGFEAATGALALFGAESESVKEAMLKVQAAMALSQGLSSLEEAGDAFKNLKAVVVGAYTSIITAKTADTTATGANTVAENSNLLTKTKNYVATGLSTVATYAQATATGVVTAAQWLWNAAMTANPIGAFVVAVTALTGGVYLLVDAMATSEAETRAVNKSIDDNARAFEKQKLVAEKSSTALQKNNQYQYDLAKANGASAEELRKLALKHKEEEAALNLKNTMLARSTFLRQRDTLATLEANDASEEQIKKQKKLTEDSWKEFEKQREGYYQSKQGILDIERKNNVERAQEQTNATNKRKEQSDKNAAEEKAKRKSDLEEIANIQKEADNYVDDIGKTARQKELEAVDDKNKAKLELLKKYGKDTTDLEKVIAEEKRLINKKYDDQEKADRKKQEDDKKAIDAKTAQDKIDFLANFKEEEKKYSDMKSPEEIEALRKSKDDELTLEKDAAVKKAEALGASKEEIKTIEDYYIKTKKENDEAAAQAEEDLAKKKTEMLFGIAQNGVDMLDSLSKIGLVKGKAAQAAQKALTLAQIGKDTASAISSLVKGSEATGAAAGPAYLPVKIATFAAGLAPILANIAKAKKLLSGDGNDTGSVSSGGSMGGAPVAASAPPAFNVVGNSGVNQLAQAVGEQSAQQAEQVGRPIQAYVVANDVTTAQGLNRNIVNNASMGVWFIFIVLEYISNSFIVN